MDDKMKGLGMGDSRIAIPEDKRTTGMLYLSSTKDASEVISGIEESNPYVIVLAAAEKIRGRIHGVQETEKEEHAPRNVFKRLVKGDIDKINFYDDMIELFGYEIGEVLVNILGNEYDEYVVEEDQSRRMIGMKVIERLMSDKIQKRIKVMKPVSSGMRRLSDFEELLNKIVSRVDRSRKKY